MIYSYIRLQKWLTRSATSRIFCWWKKIWMTTNNIYSLRNNYVYNMPTNQLFSLNFTISNQSASGIKSEIRPLICQRTHYGNLERQKRQNRFKSSSFQITRLWKHTEFRTYSFFVPVWPYSVSDRNCNPLIRYMGTSTEIQFSTLLSRINTKLPTSQNCDFHLIIFGMSIISGCLAYSEF